MWLKNSGDGVLFFVDGMLAPKRRRVRDPWLPSKALIARKAGVTGVSLGARAAASSATAVAGLRLCDQSHILQTDEGGDLSVFGGGLL